VPRERASRAALLLRTQLEQAAKLAKTGNISEAYQRLENTLTFQNSGFYMLPKENREKRVVDLDRNLKVSIGEAVQRLFGEDFAVSDKGRIKFPEIQLKKNGKTVSIWDPSLDTLPGIQEGRWAVFRLVMEEQAHALQFLKEHSGDGAFLEINKYPKDVIEKIRSEAIHSRHELEADVYAYFISLLGSENIPAYYTRSYPIRNIIDKHLGRR
jgi:hypothetical protein